MKTFLLSLMMVLAVAENEPHDANVAPNSSPDSSSGSINAHGVSSAGLITSGSDSKNLVDDGENQASDSHCKCQAKDVLDSQTDQRCLKIISETVCGRRSQFCDWSCPPDPTESPTAPPPEVPELDMDGLAAFISPFWDNTIIPSLMEYIRLNFSTPAIPEAANLIIDWANAQGVPGLTAELLTDRTHDAIYMEIPGSSNTDETIVVFGHYDKAGETPGWTIGNNLDPVIQDGHLYGRGSSDDAYVVYLVVSTVKGLIEVGGQYPRIIIIMDSAEEMGQGDSPGYLEDRKSEIGDIKYLWLVDGGPGTYDRLWIEVSTKGLVMGLWQCRSVENGVHTGLGSGVVMDNLRIMRHVLDRVENAATGEMLLPEMGVIVPPGHDGIAEEVMQLIGDNIFMDWNFLPGVEPMGEDNLQRYTWNYYGAQLAIIASDIPPNGGNTLRPNVTLHLSIRLGPSADSQIAVEALTEALTEDIPNNLICSFEQGAVLDGWYLPAFPDFLVRETDRASMKVWGNPSAFRGTGGTAPTSPDLEKVFDDVLILPFGVAHASANIHASDENLNIAYAKELSSAAGWLLHAHYHTFAV